MGGLGYVSGVQAVVVGHVGVVVALQGQHERHKGVCWNLERPHQVSLLHVTHRKKMRKTRPYMVRGKVLPADVSGTFYVSLRVDALAVRNLNSEATFSQM